MYLTSMKGIAFFSVKLVTVGQGSMNNMRTAFSPKLHTLAETNDFAVRAAKCITCERRPVRVRKAVPCAAVEWRSQMHITRLLEWI